jgi:hypothetical protein
MPPEEDTLDPALPSEQARHGNLGELGSECLKAVRWLYGTHQLRQPPLTIWMDSPFGCVYAAAVVGQLTETLSWDRFIAEAGLVPLTAGDTRHLHTARAAGTGR